MTTDPRSVLVIDNNRKQLAWITRIVRTLVRDAEARERLDEDAAAGARELVIVNYDGLDDAERQLLFGATGPAGPRVVLLSADTGNHEQLIETLCEHELCHLVAINGAPRSMDLAITVGKILSRDVFGLDKYFGWGVEAHSAKLISSADGAHFVDHVTRYARRLDVHPRLIDQLATVADELVTNALYNAPVDEAGTARFAHLPRTTGVELADDEEITASIACDGRWLGLSVTDPFGTLTREKCLEYLLCGLRRTDRAPESTKGGAGLGFYMTFDSLNQLAVNIAAGTRTEVIGLIDVSGSYKDFANRGKSFNIFLQSEDD